MPTDPQDGNRSLNSKFPIPGQRPSATSLPVVVASDQSPIPVTVTGMSNDVNIHDSNGNALDHNGAGALKVDGSAITQPISAASLPLPAGASTSANQATANASLASIDGKLTAPLSVTGPLTDVQLRATPVPVSAASLPLPTGAATAANQATEIVSLASIDSKLSSPVTTRGERASSASVNRVASSASNVSLLASNASRKGAIFYNDSAQSCFLKFGATASSTDFTVKMAPGATFIVDDSPIYTGQIDGIWDVANGAMQVTEL